MEVFKIKCQIENIANREKSALISQMLVDTGSGYTWVSSQTLEKLNVQREKKDVAFIMANGQVITRSIGFAIIRYDKFFTIDEIVFAEKGDLLLLGANA
jgi:predicted aspartyl protease